MPPLPPVTQALILINVALFCLEQVLGSMGSAFVGLLALFPVGEGFWPWQLATYAFLHASFTHLLFNMLGLWMFGSELERLWGRQRYMQFYAASVLAAGLTQLLVAYVLQSPYPTVGASGGIFGLLLAYGLLFPHRTILLWFVLPLKARTFVIIFGALELYLGYMNPTGGTAHFAHLGGMLGGWLLIRYWRGQPPFGRR